MANTAGVLGKTAAQQEHMADAAATLAAFTAIWYTPSTMTVASGTQSTFAMALDIGAVPPRLRSPPPRTEWEKFASARSLEAESRLDSSRGVGSP